MPLCLSFKKKNATKFERLEFSFLFKVLLPFLHQKKREILLNPSAYQLMF